MNYSKTTSLFNGNGNRYRLGVPALHIPLFGNETAKQHFEKQTDLKLIQKAGYYEAKPKTFKQLVKVFLTYDFKCTFYNNAMYKNTLILKWNKE